MDSLHCPSCGAPLAIQNRFVKMVACDFCAQVSLLKRGALERTGTVAMLADLPSILFLDAKGTLRDKPFHVLGRLQYGYDAGYWHEWFLAFEDGAQGWLQEDEGRFTLYHKVTLEGPAPRFDDIRVGESVRVSGQMFYVTEKGNAKILGGEGQLAFQILPGEVIQYVDGTSDGAQMSLEYAADEIELMKGYTVDRADLDIEEPDYGGWQ